MFLENYMGQSVLDGSTLRKNYIQDIYQETLSPIQVVIQGGPIWMSIHETTDVEGRFIGNVIIGKLCNESTDLVLLNCEN